MSAASVASVAGGSAAAAAPTVPARGPEGFPPLAKLAAAAPARGVASDARAPLEGLPTELSKAVWKEVRALLKRHERSPSCADMYPFVRACWRVEELDVSDASKWLTDASLGALGSVDSLRTVRLTGCRFVSDDGMPFATRLPALTSVDLSWTEVGDAGVASLARCVSLRSLNLTGLGHLTDAAVSSLLPLQSLERLSLACTPLTDAALDYLTYYTRYPDAGPPTLGVHGLRWLELSNTRLTDTGVGKLVAIAEDGAPYGRVFKRLEYLALSMTSGVGPAAVRQVRSKYGFDAPLPNAPRTLAKSNAVALEAQSWVLRLPPTDRSLPIPSRPWEAERIVGYVAQYTKEMATSLEVIRMLTAADQAPPPPPPSEGPAPKRPRVVASMP